MHTQSRWIRVSNRETSWLTMDDDWSFHRSTELLLIGLLVWWTKIGNKIQGENVTLQTICLLDYLQSVSVLTLKNPLGWSLVFWALKSVLCPAELLIRIQILNRPQPKGTPTGKAGTSPACLCGHLSSSPAQHSSLMNYKWPFIATTSAGHSLLWPPFHPCTPSLLLFSSAFSILPLQAPGASYFDWFFFFS